MSKERAKILEKGRQQKVNLLTANCAHNVQGKESAYGMKRPYSILEKTELYKETRDRLERKY